MINVQHRMTGTKGVTVGLRKDGSRAILFNDDTIQWYSASDFAFIFKAV